ncbi:MAG: hypothetical protein ACE5QW_07355 [Thermoplasmata archaeon]
MGTKEEIFEEFFKKLEKNEKFPHPIIKELKNLWQCGEILSQEKILDVIKRGCADVCED